MRKQYPILEPTRGASVRLHSIALAVMTKAPRAGAVKTRLTPPLTPAEAAELSACFLRDTAANITDVVARTGAQGVVVYTPKGSESAFDDLLPAGFSLLRQRGTDLSDRLIHASEDLLGVGYKSFCLIGSDSPTLPGEILTAAVNCLSRAGDRVVLGGTDDGGYYLIGMKRAHHQLFAGIEWSTAQVLSQTIDRAARINLEVEMLPTWYDVDDAESLNRLSEELFASNGQTAGYAARSTKDYLARLIEEKGQEYLWPNAESAKAL